MGFMSRIADLLSGILVWRKNLYLLPVMHSISHIFADHRRNSDFIVNDIISCA